MKRRLVVLERPDDLDVWAPPYRRNPSAWNQRIPIALMASFAFVAAAYMGLYQWGLIPSVWDPIFGDQTETVLDSATSETMHRWFGVPDAVFGAIAYLGDAVFGLAGSTRRWQYRPWLVVLFGLDVIPLGIVSATLVFMQGAVVGAWCTLCLFTAVISLVLIPFAYDEVWSTITYLRRVWKGTRSGRVVWKTFWGGRPAEAEPFAIPEDFRRKMRGAA